jgi:type I restriction enzyme, S subunit
VIGPPQYGLSIPASSDGNVPIIGMKDMVDSRIADGQRTLILASESEVQSCTLNRGDLLLNRTNSPDLVGKLAIWDREEVAVFASYLVRYPARSDKALPRFTIAALSTSRSSQQIDRLITRAISQANINPSAFYDEVEIAVPLVQEQQRIVAVLDAWDQAIDQTERLIAAKKQLYTSIYEKSFSPPQSEVNLVALSSLVAEVRRSNDGTSSPVMMISSLSGFVRQDEMYDREMAGDSLSKYVTLKRGEFAYNKGNSLTYPYGCIFRLTEESAHVPFVYFCFQFKNELDARFMEHFFAGGGLNAQLRRIISSSARGNGLLNINRDDFFACVVPSPSKETKEIVSQTLSEIKKSFTLLEQQLARLRSQKGGLMQKLLTGEWQLDERSDPVASNTGNGSAA